MRVNHVAIAVRSIDEYLAANSVLYSGFSRGPLIVNDVQQVREMFISDGRAVFELLEPLSDASPLNGFLKRTRGGGLYHVAYDVDSLEDAIATMDEAGGRVVVKPVPDIAFQWRRIAFVILNGQLVELIEMPRSTPS